MARHSKKVDQNKIANVARYTCRIAHEHNGFARRIAKKVHIHVPHCALNRIYMNSTWIWMVVYNIFFSSSSIERSFFSTIFVVTVAFIWSHSFIEGVFSSAAVLSKEVQPTRKSICIALNPKTKKHYSQNTLTAVFFYMWIYCTELIH